MHKLKNIKKILKSCKKTEDKMIRGIETHREILLNGDI
jgi:hypothetical protein